jgi:hypothetical protein
MTIRSYETFLFGSSDVPARTELLIAMAQQQLAPAGPRPV